MSNGVGKAFWNKFEDIVRIPEHMDNATHEAICDDLGEINEMRKAIDKKEKFLKAWMKNEMEQDSLTTVEGQRFNLEVAEVSQERISSELCQQVLSEDQLAAVTATIEMSRMTFRRRPGQ